MVAGGVQAASSLGEEGRAAGWAARRMRAVSLLLFLFLSTVLLQNIPRRWSPFLLSSTEVCAQGSNPSLQHLLHWQEDLFYP